MTWGRRYGDSQNCQYYEPLCTYEGMSKRLRESYLLMAEENDALVSPVGAAWSHSKLTDSTIVLHSGDNSHPNINGSYLAACVFYSSIYQESTIGSTYTAGIDQSIVDYLQQISHDVVIDSLGNWFLDKHEIIADFGINSMNDIVMFNSSSSTNGNYYTWDFGDGNTYNSDEVSVEYSYSEPGEYNVQLIVSNENPECDYENVEPDTTEMSIIISSTGLLNHQNKIKVTNTGESLHIQSGIPLSCIQLYSIDGRLVKDTDISSNSFDLQLEALYTGIYLLRIEDATGYWTTEKLFIENR